MSPDADLTECSFSNLPRIQLEALMQGLDRRGRRDAREPVRRARLSIAALLGSRINWHRLSYGETFIAGPGVPEGGFP